MALNAFLVVHIKNGMSEGEAIENKLVSKAIENAQKKVEAHNFEIRKTLLDYDNVCKINKELLFMIYVKKLSMNKK